MSTQYLTVSALTKYIKRKFDVDPYLERVFLTGEISNYRKRPAHQYFDVKDEHAVISGIMYRHNFQRMKFDLKDGMKVLIVGRISLYEPSGRYSIVIEHMEPDGVGALYQAYIELRDRLAKEGLFSLPKKSLPVFPKRIAVVTSPSGAVIRDIMTTIERRFPIVQVDLFPTVVQGKDSAQSIVTNLKRVDKANQYDVVIVGRGGGSIEDLWSFNEEAVIRQIVSMTIPVISSVGHETDTTLSDLAADVRAATPTAAAELSVPVLADLIDRISKEQQRLNRAMRSILTLLQEKLNRSNSSYVLRQPNRLYEAQLQRLDQTTEKLQSLVSRELTIHQHNYKNLALRILNASPDRQIKQYQKDLGGLQSDLHQSITMYLVNLNREFAHRIEELDLLSPLKIMARGYSFVTMEERILTSVEQAKTGEAVQIHLYDGVVDAKIESIKESERE